MSVPMQNPKPTTKRYAPCKPTCQIAQSRCTCSTPGAGGLCHLWASACESAWCLDLCRKPASEDWCLLCLAGLTCLALAATKLAGSLTIPRGAGAGPVRARRFPGLPCAAARPGWGPSQGLLLSMSIESPAWGCPGWGCPGWGWG